MWKKFLSLVASVAVFATILPATVVAAGDYFSPFTVTPTSFDPIGTPGDSVTVSYTVLQEATFNTYAVGPSNSRMLLDSGVYDPNPPSADVKFDWYGTSDNTATGAPLDAGYYNIEVYAIEGGISKQEESIQVKLGNPVTVPATQPNVTNVEADPVTFSAVDNEVTDVTFDLDITSLVTVLVKKGASVVKTYATYSDRYLVAGDYSVSWNGRDDDGDLVADGAYTVEITAFNEGLLDRETVSVTVDSDNGSSNQGVITNFTLDPRNSWDPTDEELKIEYDLEQDVSFLRIDAKKGSKVIEIIDEDDVDDGDYEEEWDGTDDDGDYVDEGTWEIIIRADSDTITQTVEVEYDKPEITGALVTKDSFDPSRDEIVYLVYKLDTEALVTVDVYQGSSKEFTLLDEEEVSKNRWYVVEWDGYDQDGDEVSNGQDWKFKIRAENLTDDDIFSTETIEVDVEEDDVSSNKSNVTNDGTDPVVFDDDEDDELVISYCLDEDAEVFIAIYEGTKTSGSEEIELLDYVDQDSGCHTVAWNGRDADNKKLSDGDYTYKIVSKVGSRKDTETGQFVVGNAGDDTGVTPPPVEPTECDVYWDVDYLDNSSELCEAIDWATDQGIVSGYPDGSFRPYDFVNRAEVLRMIFEAYDNIAVLPADGNAFGFSDVDPWAWYMPYVRTAKLYGMLDGYGDGTARLANTINRVELLKFALEASESFAGFNVPTYTYDYYEDAPASEWYGDYVGVNWEYILLDDFYYGDGYYFNPASLVERGEVVVMLYRMDSYGMLY